MPSASKRCGGAGQSGSSGCHSGLRCLVSKRMVDPIENGCDAYSCHLLGSGNYGQAQRPTVLVAARSEIAQLSSSRAVASQVL